uniref:D-beta-hydroxybutyrate dehydrogenase, mitochondrial-like n=1 Tax=Monopterus albus TaxID=43700 RepID=UPI0009B3E8DC|nr:D-beta-hydroxybutyrate dehydrogenase, mitochondrial-like [Monopterus albus]
MASRSVLRVAFLVSFSVLLTVVLGFGLPPLLNAVLGLPEMSVTECIVVMYLVFVLVVATPRIPRGLVEVKGKAVFITGCDSGFGNALAKHMHKMGFTVFAGCLLKDKGGKGAKELEEFHSDRMKVVQLDVCSEEQVNQAVEYIKDNLEDSERGLWAVVNNAGMSTFGEVEFTSIDTYKQVSEVNLWGVIRVTKAVLPLIRRAKGRIVNMSSMYTLVGSYCSTGHKDMAPVLDDITDAIVSKRPYTRYNPTESHWWIRSQLITHLPGAISDLLYF